MQSTVIRKVAILGAGVMGAQIAAWFANKVPTILFDLPAKEGSPNNIVNNAIKSLAKLKPSPLTEATLTQRIAPANYDQHLHLLTSCDLILEAVAERTDIKESLYRKIAPHIGPNALLASNTSGISINQLSEFLPKEVRPRFCGIHFFNPPRYMKLVELIPSDTTDLTRLASLETFLVSALGKGVIHAKDTPNFIANRVGVFSLLSTMQHAITYDIPFEVVDTLTGPLLGRPKSATYRTTDVVGLDTMAHVIHTMTEQLRIDPWHRYYQMPNFINQLVAAGALGQKSGAGIYKKEGKTITVYDVASGTYRPADKTPDPAVLAILKETDMAVRFAKLRACDHSQAQFLWACWRDLFHYCAVHASSIAHTVRDIDLAIRWGFGWQRGPFETWQAAGWQEVAAWIAADIEADQTLADTKLPNWVLDKGRVGVYEAAGAYSPNDDAYLPRRDLPVYQRQLFPDAVLKEKFNEGETIYESDAVRLWHQGDEIAILSFKSKKNTVSQAVLDGIIAAVEHTEQQGFKALVIWQRHGDHFSYGADLREFSASVMAGNYDAVLTAITKFQQATSAIRYAAVPVVGAVKGMALGGGCEVLLHCDQVVAAIESYIGLVEIGVGLLPAGGGTKEYALRAAQEAGAGAMEQSIAKYYMQIAQAQVSGSALEAKQRGILRPNDTIIFNADELLYVAKSQARALAESNYLPPQPPMIRVAGKSGIATIQMALVNMREGQFISDYDYYLGCKIAEAICGGQIEADSYVDEAWLLRLEREMFIEFLKQEKTLARIQYTLEQGKPLRN